MHDNRRTQIDCKICDDPIAWRDRISQVNEQDSYQLISQMNAIFSSLHAKGIQAQWVLDRVNEGIEIHESRFGDWVPF